MYVTFTRLFLRFGFSKIMVSDWGDIVSPRLVAPRPNLNVFVFSWSRTLSSHLDGGSYCHVLSTRTDVHMYYILRLHKYVRKYRYISKVDSTSIQSIRIGTESKVFSKCPSTLFGVFGFVVSFNLWPVYTDDSSSYPCPCSNLWNTNLYIHKQIDWDLFNGLNPNPGVYI